MSQNKDERRKKSDVYADEIDKLETKLKEARKNKAEAVKAEKARAKREAESAEKRQWAQYLELAKQMKNPDTGLSVFEELAQMYPAYCEAKAKIRDEEKQRKEEQRRAKEEQKAEQNQTDADSNHTPDDLPTQQADI